MGELSRRKFIKDSVGAVATTAVGIHAGNADAGLVLAKELYDETGNAIEGYMWLRTIDFSWHNSEEYKELQQLYEVLTGEPIAIIDNELLENTITGESVRFFITKSGRAYFDYIQKPDGKVPFPHEHSELERFSVYTGQLKMILDGKTHYAADGDTVDVVEGTVHQAWNESHTQEVGVLVSFPESDIQVWLQYFYEFWNTCDKSKVDRDGNPCMLEVLMKTAEFELDTYPEGIPHTVVDAAKRFVARTKAQSEKRAKRRRQHGNTN